MTQAARVRQQERKGGEMVGDLLKHIALSYLGNVLWGLLFPPESYPMSNYPW